MIMIFFRRREKAKQAEVSTHEDAVSGPHAGLKTLISVRTFLREEKE